MIQSISVALTSFKKKLKLDENVNVRFMRISSYVQWVTSESKNVVIV